jgi:hypothetical protein
VAHPQIAVFARLADGGAKRLRSIEGQKTLLGRTMHAIEYDAIHDEIVVPQHFGQGILTFSGDATGETPPKRAIFGPSTRLIALDQLNIDPVNNEIYVPEGREVLVFPREGNGDVAPRRIITGPNTGFADADSVAIDPIRNLLVIAGTPPRTADTPRRRGTNLFIYDRTVNGDAKPLRVISGVPGGRVHLYPEGGLIFVVVPEGYAAVYNIQDKGDVQPRYTIGGPNGQLKDARGLTIDAKNKAVIMSDKYLNAVLTFHVPELFTEAATAER